MRDDDQVDSNGEGFAAKSIDTSIDADMHWDTQAEPGGRVEGVARPWRVAESLVMLRNQVNSEFPGRRKASDGAIGDSAHASRASDHNPWVIDGAMGVVTAMDITHDPVHGCDAGRIVEALRSSRDQRIKYLIWNRRIMSSTQIGSVPAWTWRTYTGKNPHDHHFHLSVKPDKSHYDSHENWSIAPAINEIAIDEKDIFAPLERALAVIGLGSKGRSLIERLVETQDEIGLLITEYIRLSREEVAAAQAGLEAATSFPALKSGYEELYSGMTIRPEYQGTVGWYRSKLLKLRPRYEEVSVQTGAPWWFIGIVHALEGAFSLTGHLHNGDPLTARTVQVPKGRPAVWNPPSDWVSSAVDAITHQGYAHQNDWTLAKTLFRFEGYNGFGYHAKGINSPYLWSFSNQYKKGKFVRDGVFDPQAVSKQCGAAVMLHALELAGDIAPVNN